MLERLKASPKLEVAKSSSYLRNLCLGIGLSALSMLPKESHGQEIPEDWTTLNSFFANYPCTWSERMDLNTPLSPIINGEVITSTRGAMSGGILCSGVHTRVRGPHFPDFYDTCDDQELMTGNLDGLPASNRSLLVAHSVGPEGIQISTEENGLDVFVTNFEGDLVRIIDYYDCTQLAFGDMEARNCILVSGQEFLYDAYTDKLLIVGGTRLTGMIHAVEWSAVVAAYNAPVGSNVLVTEVEVAGTSPVGIYDVAMVTPHHMIFLDYDGYAGLMTRTTNGWISNSNPIPWELYQALDHGTMIYWDQNYQGVFDVLSHYSNTFVRVQCGDITTLYPGEPSFEEVHAQDLAACPEGQVRNESFNCELDCAENQGELDGECVDLCLHVAACNEGQAGACEFPPVGEDCLGNCTEGFDLFNDQCLVECQFPTARNMNGVCVDTCQDNFACNIGSIDECVFPPSGEDCFGQCLEEYERVGEACLEICQEFQARDENFVCRDLCVNAMACNNGEIGECIMPDPNENCEGVCLEGFERVSEDCSEICDENQMRYADGECRDIPIEMDMEAGSMAGSEMDMDVAGMQMAGMEAGNAGVESVDMEAGTTGFDSGFDMNMAGSEMDMDVAGMQMAGIESGNTGGSEMAGIEAGNTGGSEMAAMEAGNTGGCNAAPNSNSGWFAIGLMALARTFRRRKQEV